MKLSSTGRRTFVNRLALASGWLALPFARPVHAKAIAEPLVIWFTVEGAKGMRRAAEAFTANTGVPVIVETPDEGPSKFQQAASAGKGPDIYAYSHDRIGEWVAGGLLLLGALGAWVVWRCIPTRHPAANDPPLQPHHTHADTAPPG